MYLLRLLTLNGLLYNQRILVKYIDTKSNYLADHLSRLRVTEFLRLAPLGTRQFLDVVSEEINDPEQLWLAALR